MDFSENYDLLLNYMNVNFEKKKVQHVFNKKSPLFPFKMDKGRTVFDNGFYNVFGEFSRILLNKRMKNDVSLDGIIHDITENDIEIEDGNEEYLNKLIREYIFNEKNELKLLHPYLYLYIPLSSGKRSSGEKELALFLRDIFCLNNQNLVDFFKSNGSNHIIINLILDNAPELEDYDTEIKYSSKLDYVQELFIKDMEFAINNEKFFLDNMDNIFAYYYFFYISQLILKISKRLNCDDDVEELFYLLDWENASKNRKTLNNGYRFLKNETDNALSKVNLIFQLNTLLGTEFYLEKEMQEFFIELNNESQQNFLRYLKKWISDYRCIRGFDEIYLPDDYNQLVNILSNSLNESITKKQISLFTLNLEEIAKPYFLKRRGSYGYVLNINRDMLLMLTALCVKDNKIKLNQLFKEYEKRGIFLDKYSKVEVVNFLTKLNLIDKKSDSGDAQYVKPVI